MNQVMAILVAVFAVGLVYFICSLFKEGTCDIEKLFNLLVIIVSMVTGIYLCIHAIALARASQEDGGWLGVAGVILAAFSFKQTVLMFRELFARKVQPTKAEDSVRPTE